MDKIYSHSRISTFEQCPLKFKYRYLDKIIPKVEKSIEAHLGKSVHSALEWLYTQVKEKRVPILDELIVEYSRVWEENYSLDLLSVNKNFTHQDYFNKGVEFLITYYLEYRPFDDNTLEVEKKILINLDEEGVYKIQGFIDRISYNLKTNEYEIHDYKTANFLPNQEKLEKDRQLALYSIAVKDIFGKEKEVILIWHYLAHNKKIHVKKTNEQLELLKRETIEIIKNIETTTEFFPEKSTLCNWCEYKDICPEWEEAIKEEELDKYPLVKKYIKD
jgi:putative RecB family exonuclease